MTGTSSCREHYFAEQLERAVTAAMPPQAQELGLFEMPQAVSDTDGSVAPQTLACRKELPSGFVTLSW